MKTDIAAKALLLVSLCLSNHLQGAEPAEQDLRGARANFKTQLQRRNPAPQEFKPETPPRGVTEKKYDSSGLTLKVWVSDDPKDGKKHPAVVYLHGGFSFDRNDWDQASPYLKAGFVV